MSTTAVPSPEAAFPPPQAPRYALFDSKSVALATFFGTPAAGATLMLMNDRHLGQSGRGAVTLILAVLATAAIIALTWNVPQAISTGIAIGLVFGLQAVAQKLQGSAVEQHVKAGGRLASKWLAFGISMIFLLVLVAIAFFTIFLPAYRLDHGPKVVVGTKDEIYYSGAATQADAQALGKALKTDGYLTDQGVTVLLDKGASGPVVSFVVKEGMWDRPETVASFDEIGREVAPEIGGLPIEVRLINKNRDVKAISRIGKVDSGNDHVFYLGAATQTQAQALADALKANGYLAGNGADVFITKHNDGTSLTFVVGDGVWNDAAMIASFEKIARDAAPKVGGLPIHLRLASTSLEVKKDEPLN